MDKIAAYDIQARFDATSLVAYQAYRAEIALPAAIAKRLGMPGTS